MRSVMTCAHTSIAPISDPSPPGYVRPSTAEASTRCGFQALPEEGENLVPGSERWLPHLIDKMNRYDTVGRLHELLEERRLGSGIRGSVGQDATNEAIAERGLVGRKPFGAAE